ncbi:hypothetical protein [Micromonospora sp. NPDC048830]|uniref:hypothetical protein n=1 Tax=Micromonospora sp. NPDC048830 TaxID=3364257 RepID=UPI003724BB74
MGAGADGAAEEKGRWSSSAPGVLPADGGRAGRAPRTARRRARLRRTGHATAAAAATRNTATRRPA